MKRNQYRCQGFLAGALTAVLILGLGGAAVAASRTIQIDDGITVTINGARFSPRNVSGEEVPLFSYNGTTYAPVRALCEAAGMTVNYDSTTSTAVLTTQDMVLAADPNADSYISADMARDIAATHAAATYAGVYPGEAVFLKTKLDWDDGHACYEVEFYCGDTEYNYDVDAFSGEVLGWSHELDCYDIHYIHSQSHHGENHHSSIQTADLIGAAAAQALALKQAPAGAAMVKCELDLDDGRYVYEVELRSGRTEYECDINAVTGVILKWVVDYD